VGAAIEPRSGLSSMVPCCRHIGRLLTAFLLTWADMQYGLPHETNAKQAAGAISRSRATDEALQLEQ